MTTPFVSPHVIETSRLRLRQWREADKASFAAMSADPEVMYYFPSTLDAEASAQLIERFAERITVNGWGFWAAELKSSGECIGLIGLHLQDAESGIPHAPLVEIGWRIARSHWRQGYAEEGARAALRFAFDTLGLDRVYAFTAVVNEPSCRLMTKLGMRNIMQDFDHPKLAQGHRLERHYLYMIERSDFA